MIRGTIWHIISNRWFSAISSYCLQASRALELEGFENIVTPLEGSPVHGKALDYGMDVRPVTSFNILNTPLFKKYERAIKPSYIFLYGGPETTIAKFFSREVRLVRFRGRDNDGKQNKWLLRLAHTHIDEVIVPSEGFRRFFEPSLPCPVRAIPYGADECSYLTSIAHGEGRPTLTVVGRLDPIKGHREFFSYFREVLDAWSGGQAPFLRIIGKEANLKVVDLEEAAARANLAVTNYEIIPELVPDITSIMVKTSLGVVCSLGSEVICRVGAEFLLNGTPIAVTDVGSLGELLFEDAGVCYSQMSPRDFASFLQRCHSEKVEIRLSRQRRATELFSTKAMGAHLKKLVSIS